MKINTHQLRSIIRSVVRETKELGDPEYYEEALSEDPITRDQLYQLMDHCYKIQKVLKDGSKAKYLTKEIEAADALMALFDAREQNFRSYG